MVNQERLDTHAEAAPSLNWWNVSIGSQFFMVKAADEEAALAEAREVAPIDFPTISVIPVSEAGVPQLDEHYGDRKVIRVIPYSLVEWTEYLNNMTPEQAQAFYDARRFFE